ncbi:putative trichothecene 3-O-acetyltransferase [Xylariaceae sp. FL0804]|nr:putative trichothecene 3-O-acetyltransferase [Xylariaceae sp. FL0804]
MASTTRFETHPVWSSEAESLPDTTRFQLSDLDQQVPGNHTSPCVVFPFDGRKDDLVRHLQTGLQNVLTCIPLVGGELLSEDGRIIVLRRNREPLQLGPGRPGLSRVFFAANARRLTPPGAELAGMRRDDGCPVAVFQANFIRGGVIITLPLHHMCGDAKSIDHTLTLWASSTRAAAEGKPMPGFRPLLDRSYFNAASVPVAEELQAKKANIRGFTFHPIQNGDATVPLTDPPKLPPTTITIYHFSAAQCQALKEACSPSPDNEFGVTFVSSYDAICGLTWQAMVRAKIPFLKPDLPTAKTSYAHPVDARGRFVSRDYFGNGFCMIATDHILMSDLVDRGVSGTARAAQLIRASTQSFTKVTIPDLTAVRSGLEAQGEEEMRWLWRSEDVVGTSWSGMRAIQAYDFGFGLPTALRLSVMPFEGVLGLLPASRPGDGFDVPVVLEEGCQRRLGEDAEFMKYCSILGA